jgi:FAD/FMN-containing dehydrogenase
MTRKGNEPGRTFRRGEDGYEQARRDCSFNARLADRYPDLIVQANNTDDVVTAVRAARRDGMTIGVRSGGHSWAGNHIRDGGMLLDLSRLDHATIDRVNMTATAGPGTGGYDLAMALAKEKLFFPAGHCKGVCIGGYLLQGGYGWHSRALGPACESVIGIDYVDAEGDLRHASAEENADIFWAARGAGPGFFGVVTRFHLKLYPRPRVMGMKFAVYGEDRFEEVFRWAHRVGPDVPEAIELMLIVSRQIPFVRGPGMLVVAPVFEDSLSGAYRALEFMKSRPLGARLVTPFVPMKQAWMYAGVMEHYPSDHRYAVDNMWTHASIEALMPGLRRITETLPTAPSHMLWMNWAPPKTRPDMAYSMEDDIYIALYGVCKDAADDASVASWAEDKMAAMALYASGMQLADENLGRRPAKFLAEANLSRLDALRAAKDPQGRFHPYMGRP